MPGEQIITEIDWSLPLKEFKNQIRQMISSCRQLNKVITLPLTIQMGIDFLPQLASIIAHVNCDNCDAPCCRIDSSGEQMGISLLQSDYQRLKALGLAYHVRIDSDGMFINYPCPFFEAKRCRIYQDRPLICILYPFQPGGLVGVKGEENSKKMSVALSNDCPEAIRITKQIYVMTWRLMNGFQKLSPMDYNLFNMMNKKSQHASS